MFVSLAYCQAQKKVSRPNYAINVDTAIAQRGHNPMAAYCTSIINGSPDQPKQIHQFLRREKIMYLKGLHELQILESFVAPEEASSLALSYDGSIVVPEHLTY